jgi:hypothetical protein
MIKTKEKKTVKEGNAKEMPRPNLELAAYFHWQERGCPVNDDLTDWLAVEQDRRGRKGKEIS